MTKKPWPWRASTKPSAARLSKEWTRESELAYVVQSGTFESLGLKWRNSSLRRNYSSNEFDESRLIISYPLSTL
ncbi:TPA: OprD family outer membrane porin [Pseudomonas aeruginosa]|nr:OprD family outer membrane porin [Pseudomonas aeruginosa]